MGKENSLDNQGPVNNNVSILRLRVFVKSLCATACEGLKKFPAIMGARILFCAIESFCRVWPLLACQSKESTPDLWCWWSRLFFVCLDLWLDMMMSFTLQWQFMITSWRGLWKVKSRVLEDTCQRWRVFLSQSRFGGFFWGVDVTSGLVMCCTFEANSFRALRERFSGISAQGMWIYVVVWYGGVIFWRLQVVKVKLVQFHATGDVYVANTLSSWPKHVKLEYENNFLMWVVRPLDGSSWRCGM